MQRLTEKGGFEHFMLKEIYEQPKSIRDTMTGRVPKDSHGIEFTELGWTEEEMAGINKILLLPVALLIMQVLLENTIWNSWHGFR